MRRLPAIAASAAAFALQGQSLPVPDANNPRLQTLQVSPDDTYRLLALPETGLTVLFERGERITRATISDADAFEVSVSPAADSFMLRPRGLGATSEIAIVTDMRQYRFLVDTQDSLLAAYLVRFEAEPAPSDSAPDYSPQPTQTWAYRIRGDREVQPARVHDDGRKTRIFFAPEQALPAIFAIGPTGEEQAVNGYMRGEAFIIDRVFEELVFRIDKEKATAKRQSSPEAAG
ncbi:TrbG/VirB9 family P-type conjugative transfer protein [Qipengyuania sp. DSG2-2]|uniref:TrbG/VirB9 family P-type conjugative transfer protein n=1 Tax=Qipengyuania sp. DGS2-2 TaxID=3349631 RepID=UPI0036D3EE52